MDKLVSGWNNVDLLMLQAKNTMFYIFELIGIYEEFCKNEGEDDFEKYYHLKHNETKYHFRNIGVQTIYEQILKLYSMGVNRVR